MRNLFVVTLNNGDSCCVILAQMLHERFVSHVPDWSFITFVKRRRIFIQTILSSKRYLIYYHFSQYLFK